MSGLSIASTSCSVQNPASSKEELSSHSVPTFQEQLSTQTDWQWSRCPSRRSASNMLDRSPTLPPFNDGRGSFTALAPPQDADVYQVSAPQPDTVLGGGLTAEPMVFTADRSDCSSVVSRRDMYIAATPVSYMSGLRYQRRELFKDDDPKPDYREIGLRNTKVPNRQLPTDCNWMPYVHPEGSVYFRQENWFTNVWLYDKENLADIDAAKHLVSLELRSRGIGLSEVEVGLDICPDADSTGGGKLGCYYIWSRNAEEVFWLDDVSNRFFYDGTDMKILGREHLAQAAGIGYWDHMYMFPHGRNLTKETLHVLRADITYYIFDKKTSKSSTAPYSKDDLRDLLDVLKEVEEVAKDDHNALPQHVVIVSRLKETLCRERFMRYYGERYAQLDSDRSVYEGAHRQRSIPFTILTWLFFFTPPIYFERLCRIWVDSKVNYEQWRSFIGELQDDWTASITPSAVILTANVGFLAIQSVDQNGMANAHRSMGQIVSYMSTLLSIGNIVACTILARQHRPSMHCDAEEAVNYLSSRATTRIGVEKLSIIFSIPTAFFLWALLTFCIAILWECFHETDVITRVTIAIAAVVSAMLLIVIMHNGEWRSEPGINSLSDNMARMKTIVKAARKFSQERWTTLVEWRSRKTISSRKGSYRSSNASSRTSIQVSPTSVPVSNGLPQGATDPDDSLPDGPTMPPGLSR